MFSVCFVTLLVLLLTGFLLFVVFWQRRRSNHFISERERREILFKEQLLTSQLEMQEQTFNNISMEIHDNVGQTLSLLKVQLNILNQKEQMDKTLLKEALNNVGHAMTDLRDIAKSLNSDRITSVGLPEMTLHEAQRISNTGIIAIQVVTEGIEGVLGNGKKLILFRIIQECLQNIIKHAGATLAIIGFTWQESELIIEVKDNGAGFDSVSSGKGLGLKNMFTRAAVIGSNIHIDSLPEKGTIITITTSYE